MDPIFNRIKKEYDDLKDHQKETTVEVWMVNNDIRHWKGKISGSSDTCIFTLFIFFIRL